MTKPSILFAFKQNAGRSVTSKVLPSHSAGNAADVFSAGSEPGEEIQHEVPSPVRPHDQVTPQFPFAERLPCNSD